MIVKRGKKWCLLSRKTRRNLGCYDSLAGVQRRERQVQYFKHRKSLVSSLPELDLSYLDVCTDQDKIAKSFIWKSDADNYSEYVPATSVIPGVLKYLKSIRQQLLAAGLTDIDFDIYYNLLDDTWHISAGDWVELGDYVDAIRDAIGDNFTLDREWAPHPRSGWVKLKDVDNVQLLHAKHRSRKVA